MNAWELFKVEDGGSAYEGYDAYAIYGMHMQKRLEPAGDPGETCTGITHENT